MSENPKGVPSAIPINYVLDKLTGSSVPPLEPRVAGIISPTRSSVTEETEPYFG